MRLPGRKRGSGSGPVRPALRIALPVGPGATLLYGQVAASLIAVGITPVRVGPTAEADLRLIDRVAPYDSARWYLATACAPCGETALATILAARDAPTLDETQPPPSSGRTSRWRRMSPSSRSRAPLRWSLVAVRLRQWQPNARAWHPLNWLRPRYHLRAMTNGTTRMGQTILDRLPIGPRRRIGPPAGRGDGAFAGGVVRDPGDQSPDRAGRHPGRAALWPAAASPPRSARG